MVTVKGCRKEVCRAIAALVNGCVYTRASLRRLKGKHFHCFALTQRPLGRSRRRTVAGGMLFLCLVPVCAYSFIESMLPVDEDDADVMVATGELDSVRWLELVPLLRKPLQVPLGELGLLVALFPELATETLPLREQDLVFYRPWDVAAVGQFFRDFPVLVPFSQFLGFKYPKSRHYGSLTLYLDRAGSDTLMQQTARFQFKPTHAVTIDGGTDFTTDYLRWERRSITITPTAWFTAKFGNQTLFKEDHGLFYGYFIPAEATFQDIKTNWSTGAVRSWNGLSLSAAAPRNRSGLGPSISLFMHSRPVEKIEGGTVGIGYRKCCSVSMSVSRMWAIGLQQQFLFHANGALKIAGWRSELALGARPGNLNEIPIWFNNYLKNGDNSYDVTVVYLPGGFTAPLSSVLHTFARKLVDFDADTVAESLVFIAARVGRNRKRILAFSPAVDIGVQYKNVVHAALAVVGEGTWQTLSYRATYSKHFATAPTGVSATTKNTLNGEMNWSRTKKLAMSTVNRFVFDEFFWQEYRGIYTITLQPLLHQIMKPSCTIACEKQRISSFLVGYTHQCTLYERMMTEFTVERNFYASLQRSPWRVEVMSTFIF